MCKDAADLPALAAEIEFWRVRNAAFSSLYEQLNLPSVKKYVAVLEAGSADQNLLTSFKAQFNELKKVHSHSAFSYSWSGVASQRLLRCCPFTIVDSQMVSHFCGMLTMTCQN